MVDCAVLERRWASQGVPGVRIPDSPPKLTVRSLNWIEHGVSTPGVVGSNPTARSNFVYQSIL